MNHHIHLFGRKAEQPARFDHFEAFVHERCGIDSDALAHFPGGMIQRLQRASRRPTLRPGFRERARPRQSGSASKPHCAGLRGGIGARHCARCPLESIRYPIWRRLRLPVFRLPPEPLYWPAPRVFLGKSLHMSLPGQRRPQSQTIRNQLRWRLRPRFAPAVHRQAGATAPLGGDRPAYLLDSDGHLRLPSRRFGVEIEQSARLGGRYCDPPPRRESGIDRDGGRRRPKCSHRWTRLNQG